MFVSARRSALAAVSALSLAAALAAPVLAQDAATIRNAERVRDAALNDTVAMDYVTQLTTRFGPRPAGVGISSTAETPVLLGTSVQACLLHN